MTWPANPNRIAARSDNVGDVAPAWQNECERARPERSGEFVRQGWPGPNACARHVETADVDNDWVVRRAAFQVEDAGDRGRKKRIGGEAVDSFSGQRDKFAGAEQVSGPTDGSLKQFRRVRWQNDGIHGGFIPQKPLRNEGKCLH